MNKLTPIPRIGSSRGYFSRKTALSLIVVTLLGLSFMGYLPHASAATNTVQSNFGASVCATGSTCTSTVAFTSPVTPGDMVVVSVLDEIASMPTSVTDSLSSQYQLLTSSSNGTATIGVDLSVYYAPILMGGPDTITVTDASGASTALLVSIFEISGAASLLKTVTSTSTATLTTTATQTVTSTQTSTVTTPGPTTTTTATATTTQTQTVTSTTTLPPVTSTATQTVTQTATTTATSTATSTQIDTVTTTTTTPGPTTTVTQTVTATQTSTASPPMLLVESVDQNGNPIAGYFALLYSGSGQQLSFGYTPKEFTGLVNGDTYGVFLSSFGSCTFSHWKDTGNGADPRTFTANGALTLVGVYNCTSNSGAPKEAAGIPVSVGAPLSLLTIMGALIASSTLGVSAVSSRKKKD
jgi:cobalamin biosynthesis Mg chelatase CobN